MSRRIITPQEKEESRLIFNDIRTIFFNHEINAIRSGKATYYNWTDEEKKQLLTYGKVNSVIVKPKCKQYNLAKNKNDVYQKYYKFIKIIPKEKYDKNKINISRSKGVFLAWKKETELVKNGSGTRNWTIKEQKELLEKGYVRGYEGHHKKNVNKYPHLANNPDNIQFLKENEHFEAHRRNYKNNTNGYYNYETKEMEQYGIDELKKNRVIKLTNPLVKDKMYKYDNIRSINDLEHCELKISENISHELDKFFNQKDKKMINKENFFNKFSLQNEKKDPLESSFEILFREYKSNNNEMVFKDSFINERITKIRNTNLNFDKKIINKKNESETNFIRQKIVELNSKERINKNEEVYYDRACCLYKQSLINMSNKVNTISEDYNSFFNNEMENLKKNPVNDVVKKEVKTNQTHNKTSYSYLYCMNESLKKIDSKSYYDGEKTLFNQTIFNETKILKNEITNLSINSIDEKEINIIYEKQKVLENIENRNHMILTKSKTFENRK